MIYGLGPTLVPKKLGSPLHRVTIGAMFSLLLLYLLGFAIYLLKLPAATYWVLLLLISEFAWQRRKRLVELWSDQTVRQGALGWLIITFWLLGWQFTVYSYSGATWQGDWYEHYDRAKFFLQQGDVHVKFLGVYSLSARPPLVNIVTAGFLSLSGMEFYIFQATCILLASLSVWPLYLLQRQFSPPGAFPHLGWLVLLLMTVPAFIQNATFTWTKLPTVFFILTGITLLSDQKRTFITQLVGWVCLTVAMLAHYSAGPWIAAIAIAEYIRSPSSWKKLYRRESIVIYTICALLFATWFGWSTLALGANETLSSNTTIADAKGLSWDKRLGNAAKNLYYTTIPAPFRKVEMASYLASAPSVRLRDSYFNAVQSSIPMMAGSLGVLVASFLLWNKRKHISMKSLRYWGTLIGVVLILGVIVHTEVITLGVAQVCLLPFSLLVIAWLAARVPKSHWRKWLIIGMSADVMLGIILHYAVQSLWIYRWGHPGATDYQIIQKFGQGALNNFEARIRIAEPFLYDLPVAPLQAAILIVGAGVLLIVLFFRSNGKQSPIPRETHPKLSDAISPHLG